MAYCNSLGSVCSCSVARQKLNMRQRKKSDDDGGAKKKKK
jgi:hypothetical protein